MSGSGGGRGASAEGRRRGRWLARARGRGAGPGRRRGRRRAPELRAHGEESRAAGAELEEAAAAARAAGERLGDGELPAGTAGGWELAQRRVGAVRAGGRRCSPGPAEEGSRPAGEVGGGSGSGCVCSGGGGGACARGGRRSLPVTSSRFSFCKAEPGKAGRPPASPAGRAAAGLAPRQRPACSRPPPGSRFPGRLPSGCCTPPGAIAAGVAGDLRLPPTLRHRTLLRVPTVLLLQFSGALHPDRCLCVSGKERCLPPRRPAATGVAARALPRGGRGGGGPGAHPQPPPSQVCLSPLPGWGKCASGRQVAGAVTRRLVSAGPGQVVGDILNGVLKPPGKPAFCHAGPGWRDCPEIWSRLGRAREPVSQS